MSVSGSPTSTSIPTSSSSAAVFAPPAPLELNSPTSTSSNPRSVVVASSPPQKELIRDDASSPSLSSSPSSLSATQPSTPVHASSCMTLLTTPTSPSSVNRIIRHSHAESSPSENKSNFKLHAPLTLPELADSNTTTHIRFQSSPVVFKADDSSSFKSTTNSRDLNSLSKAQTVSPNVSSPQAVKAACSNNTPNPLQTTNVYINGLPPNFKAEQLYALTSQFGTVLSCRTFTRQLSDHPSGYGFVLFDSIDSAQQCIEVLRSHHNLHPTFAKQAHKINRTTADPNDTPPPNLADSPPTVNVPSFRGTMATTPVTPAATEDMAGAEIYIEGLPINIDVPTLRVLLAPHVVKNSRFFADTRVHPPQLVAFVKLESQAAAGDVRSRLHGRTIRGYSNRLQVFFGNEFALQLASTQMTSPQANATIGPKMSSGLPMSAVENPFAGSDDPFISLAKSPKIQYMSPPSQVRFNEQNVLSPDAQRLQAGLQQQQLPQQQLSRHFSNQTLDQYAIPPQLQPLSTTLNELQAQLDNLRPLLLGYNQSNAAAVPNQLAMTSPVYANTHATHQRSDSYSDTRDFLSLKELNAFALQLQSQNGNDNNNTTGLRSPDATTSTMSRTNGKPITGSQLNPLAHTYSVPQTASVGTNSHSHSHGFVKRLQSGTSAPGLGAPLFSHSGNSSSNSMARQVTNSSCDDTMSWGYSEAK